MAYFAIGTSLAALTNVENIISQAPHVLNNQRVKLLGPLRRQTLDWKTHRHGNISGVLQWGEDVLIADIDTLVTTYWGDYLTANASLYISWLDEENHYSPFYCEAERPEEGTHYQNFNGYKGQNLAIPISGVVRQVDTENSTTTLTTSERLVESDTTSGAVDLTLAAASSYNANTVVSVVKSGGGNTLRILPDGSDTINGGSSVTVTSRTDIVSDGVSAWTSI